MQELVLFTGALPAVSGAAEAKQRRAELLGESSGIETVASAEEQAIAVEVCRRLQAEIKATENARKAVKAPVLALGAKIDAIASDHSSELETEYRRVTKEIASFQAVERQRVEREEQARREHVERLAEIERKAVEDAAIAAAKLTNAAGEKELDAAVAAEKAAVAAANNFVRAVVEPQAVVAREAGMSVKPVTKWEVTDIHALYAHNKSLVRMEANKAAINAIVAVGIDIPGLKIWQETAVAVRA